MPREIPLPKQPVLEFASIGQRPAELPSLLDLPNKVMTHSGRSAIVLALEFLGVRHGNGVLVPTYHCPTMIAPVELLGGTPVFYPITNAGTPDLDYLEKCSMHGIRAMLVPHLFGLLRPLDAIAAFCRTRGIGLIEDCAHCFFGVAGSASVGTTGDFAVGSLPKFFPVLEGGILASATRPLLAAGLRERPLSDEFRAAWDMIDLAAQSDRLGFLGTCARGASKLKRTIRHDQEIAPPANGKATPEWARSEGLKDRLLAPVAACRIESCLVGRTDLSRIVQRRRKVFLALANGLADLPGAEPLAHECSPASAPYVMPLLVQDPDEPYARMRAAGLPVFRWDRLWPGTPVLPKDSAGVWARGIIQIACHQSLNDTEVDDIVHLSRECLACR